MSLIRFARKSRHEQAQVVRMKVRRLLLNLGWRIPHVGNDRTTYVIGLFGSGRWYINELLLRYLGERAYYFRDDILFHPGPTSMIYSGHATIKHLSCFQHSPAVTGRILEAVRAGSAELDFCLSPSSGFIVDQLDLVAALHSRQQNKYNCLTGS